MNRYLKYAIIIVLGSVVVTGLILYGRACVIKAGYGSDTEFNDFTVFYEAGAAAADCRNPYDTANLRRVDRPYVYPPVFAVMMIPFTWMGYDAAAIVWFVISFMSFIGAFYLSIRIVKEADIKIPWWLWTIPLIMTVRVADSDLKCGQANSIILFLVMLSLYFLMKNREKKAGIILALSAMAKLTPLVFLPYMVLKRRITAAKWTIAGVVVLAILLPSIVIGPVDNAKLMLSYSGHLSKCLSGGDSVAGQSLFAAGMKYMTHTQAAHHIKSIVFVNVAELPKWLALLIIMGIAGAMVVLTGHALRHNESRINSLPYREVKSGSLVPAIEFSTVLLLMLMISPVSRKAHFVALILPLTLSVYYLYRLWDEKCPSDLLMAAVVYSFAIYTLTSDAILGDTASKVFLAYSTFFFSALLLWIAMISILYTLSKSVETSFVRDRMSICQIEV